MALQFFAVHSEALATTHDALQRHASRHGLRPPGPTRALRIAQLYGHLQLRASGRPSLVLAVSELAACWRFQPRQLRQDLALLQALGWLSARGTTRGTVISLSGPEQGDFQDPGADRDGDSDRPAPDLEVRRGGESDGEERDQAPLPALPLAPLPARTGAADQSCAPRGAGPAALDPSTAAPAPAAPPPAGASDNTRDLLQRLAALYNQHRPATWPAYQPRGNGLRSKLRQALKQAGSAEALADTLMAALRAMPSFWRNTYPQGRSGAECMAVLFCTDRGCAGLGVEFWHLFSWAQAASETAGVVQAGPNGPIPPGSAERSAVPATDALTTARRLLVWDSGVWRSQGREALLLSLAEKRELALILEAHGEGIPGSAAEQFADPESPSIPESPEGLTAAPQDAGHAACPITCQDAGKSGEAPAAADLAATSASEVRSHHPAAIPSRGAGTHHATHQAGHPGSQAAVPVSPQAQPRPQLRPGTHRQTAPPG